MKKIRRRLLYVIAALAVLYFILMIPVGEGKKTTSPGATPFAWKQDSVWLQLENTFRETGQLSPADLDNSIALMRVYADGKLNQLESAPVSATHSLWMEVTDAYFGLAPYIARKNDQQDWYLSYYTRVRRLLKKYGQNWDITSDSVKRCIYMVNYGMRAAAEEVLLQNPAQQMQPVLPVDTVPSVTPAANLFGIEVHSGDMLVSRGGAEVSALISRGNDYPGNFSHVALLYVDSATKKPWLIEAHIEKGVAIASAKEYIEDKKLRFMVLRLRPGLPAMQADPMLPHKAAAYMFNKAQQKHIPYDFKMDFYDSTALFCSEVASFGYKRMGIELWQSSSTISSPGVVNWLHSFGVEHFTTQMPSDLEYDPQLEVVAEWRNPETLYKDHVDNAVMDAMLEKANSGETIGYSLWKLPVVRVIKGYCMLKNAFGKVGIIPEGMNATTALRNQTFVAMHVKAKEKTLQMADAFMKEKGYRPPYWQLVKFAETALKEQ